MGLVKLPDKVKLIAGIIAAGPADLDAIAKPLERAMGSKIDYRSRILDFDKTDYYEDEMGPGLKRLFVSFEKLVPLDGIYKYKLASNRLESRYSRCGKRTVNIDTGYIDLAKVVLFSTKDFTHRIYLARGIYAEVTLHFKAGSFRAWPYTFPDYQTRDYTDILAGIRDMYKKEIGKRGC